MEKHPIPFYQDFQPVRTYEVEKNLSTKKYEFPSCQVTLFGDGTCKIDQNIPKKSSKENNNERLNPFTALTTSAVKTFAIHSRTKNKD